MQKTLVLSMERDSLPLGVYLGNSMHASTSKDVTISSLVEKYGTQHYETARRLQLES